MKKGLCLTVMGLIAALVTADDQVSTEPTMQKEQSVQTDQFLPVSNLPTSASNQPMSGSWYDTFSNATSTVEKAAWNTGAAVVKGTAQVVSYLADKSRKSAEKRRFALRAQDVLVDQDAIVRFVERSDDSVVDMVKKLKDAIDYLNNDYRLNLRRAIYRLKELKKDANIIRELEDLQRKISRY